MCRPVETCLSLPYAGSRTFYLSHQEQEEADLKKACSSVKALITRFQVHTEILRSSCRGKPAARGFGGVGGEGGILVFCVPVLLLVRLNDHVVLSNGMQ